MIGKESAIFLRRIFSRWQRFMFQNMKRKKMMEIDEWKFKFLQLELKRAKIANKTLGKIFFNAKRFNC